MLSLLYRIDRVQHLLDRVAMAFVSSDIPCSTESASCVRCLQDRGHLGSRQIEARYSLDAPASKSSAALGSAVEVVFRGSGVHGPGAFQVGHTASEMSHPDDLQYSPPEDLRKCTHLGKTRVHFRQDPRNLSPRRLKFLDSESRTYFVSESDEGVSLRVAL